MRAPSILAVFVILIACAITGFAQAQNAPAFEKKNYTYSEWTNASMLRCARTHARYAAAVAAL